MLYLAIIFHMHQPYYKNLLTHEAGVPWVRLHGIKDYLDMVQILEDYPLVRQTFNFVPSLLEQLEDYTERTVKDRFLELSYKPAKELSAQDKDFILNRFFSINPQRCIAIHPRYYELYLKKKANKEFTAQDYLDLQVWFNLAWFDPSFKQSIPELRMLVSKGRFFTEKEKLTVLNEQVYILEEIIPTYKKFISSRQVEVTISPYYHPILPLLCNTSIAKEAKPKAVLPGLPFIHPEDAKIQIEEAIKLFEKKFGAKPQGMWPSEEAVSQHILPFIIQSGIKWIVADEGVLFKSLKLKKRKTEFLYQPYLLKRKEGELNIVFRDRNLSDLIGFVYNKMAAQEAADDFMAHLENTHNAYNNDDILVTVAMDGENAWEYYANDGRDFLNLLYQRLSESNLVKTTTIPEYLAAHPAKKDIKYLAAGSWIYGEFAKWIGSPHKNRAWECLAKARQELEQAIHSGALTEQTMGLARKQIYVAEGSDWFWWYGEDDTGDFDVLFRMHLSNFYKIIGKPIPDYLNKPL